MASREITKKKRTAAGQNVRDRDYWLDKLSGDWVKCTFPYDHQKSDVFDAMEFFSFQFQDDCFSGLMRLSNESDYRLFMILAAQLVLLLYKYTCSKDIIVGVPILKQDMEGDFINTVLALRNTFDPGITFKELLLQVRQTLMEAAEHQNYPIEVLLHKLNLEEGSSSFPLFDTAILLENIHDREYIRHIDTDMVFIFRQSNRAVNGLLEYNPLHYTAPFVKGIIRHYTYLIRHMMTALNTPLRNIEILSEDEKKQLLVDFNDTEGEYPGGKTIHQLFEEQAKRTGDNIAVIGNSFHVGTNGRRIDTSSEIGKMSITYDELNKKSNQLAYLLMEKGVEPDTIVAIMVERSIEMIIGILGILKAGGAYLPIDPHYPDSRIHYMLEDSGAEILISTHHLSEGIVFEREMIYLEDYKDKKDIHHSLNQFIIHHSDSLVYLIYTSGSTGRPKGVMLEHKNVVNLIHFDFLYTNLDFSKILQFHTIGFDASFHEIFCALLSGGTLYLIEEEVRADIPALFELVERNGIVTLFLPMSYLRMVFNEESYVRMVPRCVKHIQTAGEQVVINNRFKRFLQENHVYLHNHYGPAETHVVTTLTLDPEGDIPELPSIGKPILNTSIYILDKEKQILPVGVPGELYIGGIQVGRGYLKKPKLTAEKFSQDFWDYHDYQDKKGLKKRTRKYSSTSLPLYHSNSLYRTGDLARWMWDGNIEFLGRVDKQVKIRGFRVEPGEIESRLTDIDHIKEAVVTDRIDEKGDKFLCAYVVSDIETDVLELRESLSKTLPDYMVPSYFIQLEEIPLTPNGKVDWGTLQAIEIVEEKQVYSAPRNEVEKKLCGLWAEILGLKKENIGIDHNFFQLGGHSLKATILISRIRKAFNVKISLGEIFNQPFIRGLAQFIREAVSEKFISIRPTEEKDYYPMSSSQKRMYILNQLEREGTNYNMPAALIAEGEIDAKKLEVVFRALVQRQEGLRTRFVVVDGEPVQEIEPARSVAFAIQYNDATGIDDIQDGPPQVLQEKFLDQFVRPFDLAQAPLFRVGLVKLAEKKHLLMVDIHHIIGDGVSLGILVKEFTRLYEGEDIPPLPIQYKDYAIWQQGLVQSGELKKQEEYWLEQLEGNIPVLNLPLDYPRPAKMSIEGQWLEFEIPADTTVKLNELAKQNDVTLYMVILAAYNVLLHKYTGSETIVVGSAIAGRSHSDLENIIGVFLNTLVLKNTFHGSQTFGAFLNRVGENTLRAFDNQESQFEELVEKLDIKRDYSRNPIFDTMFNFHNMEIPDVKVRDLKLTPCRLESTAVKFDIKLMAWELEDRLRCTVDYCTKLFKPETMEAFIENFLKVIDKIIEDPAVKISDIQLMSEIEKKEIIEDFTQDLQYKYRKREKNTIPGRTIQSRLLESLETHRDDIAIECENNTITYHNLHQHSNYIANWLMALGLKKESFIGIMVDDKITLVTVILGIIKAGCVFVPLDSRYPDKRTEAMLLSSETPYVFTEEDKIEKLKTIRRHLPHPIDIITINEKFYLSNQPLKLKRYDDTYKLSEAESTRYKRQILLDGWGIQGQERLKASTVFVAGAGGSGSPLIQQLALCGFGTIIICDYDTVELSNLNRQSLHDETRIGMNKALSAKKTVERMNPHINVIARQEKITLDNVFELVGDAEIIFDNVDSLEAKSYLSQCAVARGIPHIISSMIHINAYACIFHTPHTPCFHCLYDKKKIDDITKAKTQTSHYEVIPNSVASPALHLSTGFAVNEAVKILLGFGKPAYNKYIHFNQYGSPDVVFTNGYKQITYPFNHHFREISRKQGFDWDTGWHGNFVEEIAVQSDPNCSFCGKGKSSKCLLMAKKDNPGHETHGEEPFHPLYYETPPEIDYLPEDKINIYFTSGTTGQPKAVLGKNEGLNHFITWEIEEFNIDETKRVSQMTSQCHDPFLRDIFVPLCAGGTICVPDSIETLMDSQRMMNWMEVSRVNLVHCTPSLFKVIDSDGLNPESYAHLEYVLLAGEKVVPQDLENWYRVLGDRVQLVNIYGPTETTLAKLFYFINPKDLERDTIPIGKPIPGAKVIILDKELNICGPGEVGDIYIRTPFRSYGYYNDSKLTAEKFIQNPFSNNPDDIIYRTGDLGKIDREGHIEFVGREDRQVKIRGFRVELDEVEKRIRDYPGVQETVVLNSRTSTGNFILCAYFKGEIAVPELKEYLTQELPDYMVPSFYIKMEKFPLTVNKKINYNALPEPDEVERKEYAAPKNELDKRVVKIWTEILGIKKIGMNDGFLDMGGNSLNAMNLISQIYKEFSVNLQLSMIFENPTVEELVSIIEVSGKSIYQSIKPIEKRHYYPLSSAQLRMYLLKEFAGEEDISYNQTKPLFIKGRLDKERLEDAFKRLITRHDALRTGFETINGQPIQRIHKKVEFKIKDYIPVGAGKQGGLAPLEEKGQGPGDDGGEPGSQSVTTIIKDFVRAFDFSYPPLLRVGLLEVSKEEHILIFDIHHIISDGITTGVFIEEFMKLYTDQPLPELRLQYKDYAVWQQQMLHTEPLQKQEAYWMEIFEEEPPVLNLTTDYPRPAVQSFAGALYLFKVESSLIEQLEDLARESNATLYMVLLAAYTMLLYRYTGQEDIVVGSPIAGRPHTELQNIPGVFINTLAMRNFPEGGKPFGSLMAEAAENAFKAYENQDYPFEELVGKLDLRRDLNRNPLFDTLFVMQNIDQKPIVLEGLEITPYSFDVSTSKFDISLNVLETSEGYLFNMEYCTCLFRPETIEQLGRHFVTILESVAADPGQTLNSIDILSPEEKGQLIQRFNDAEKDYPESKTVHQLFEEQARRTPDGIALSMFYGIYTTCLTYYQLNRKSNQLGHLLKEKGVAPDSIVGIMVERSMEMIVGIMAILKAGGAYMPIDPEYPEERINYMLADSAAKILLSEVIKVSKVSGELEVIDLNQLTESTTQLSEHLPTHTVSLNHSATQLSSSNLAYIIYTSGSTGNPKGVMLEHRTLVNLVWYQFKHTSINFGKVLQFAAVTFDVSAQEIFSTLLLGGQLVLIDEETRRSVVGLFDLIRIAWIGTLFFPTSFLKFLMTRQDYINSIPTCVRHIVTAGEQLMVTQGFRDYLKENEVYLHNHYGPTESHVVTALTLDPGGDIPDIPSIGVPISNTGIYILDGARQLQPPGVPGELSIAGAAVARGYLNNPQLTAEKFTPIYPLYRTGDLARWLSDGTIEFLGRIDNQVKIRGYRIETGEIENRLLSHPDVEAAVVLPLEDQNREKYLCAYIVPENVELSTIKNYLSEQLPQYMIPSRFIPLESIPLTSRGKINRGALPEPEIMVEDSLVMPRNPTEETLARIWSDILIGKPDVPMSIDADFFELGGHSLKATLLLFRIHETFDVKISLLEMFKMPTIRQLAWHIQTADRETYTPIEPAEKKAFYDLSAHQRRLWIIQQLEKANTYNMPLRIELDHAVDEEVLRKSLGQLVERHDSLRTVFIKRGGVVYQSIRSAVEFPMQMMDISGMEPQEKERERERLFKKTAEAPFDLSRSPLFRCLVIKSSKTQYDLVFTMHHIISDGWSIEILKREFTLLYEGFRQGKAVQLAQPRQYKDFSEWHNRRLNDPDLRAASHRFWLKKLERGIPVFHLPVDSSVHRKDTAAAAYSSWVDSEVKERLKLLAETNNTTLSTVMFSIYNILLAHISGQDEVVCSLIGAGRDHPELQDIVGYFTNSALVIIRIDPEENFSHLVHRVHIDVMETVQHQSYPLEPVMDELGMSFPDMPVTFNMLNIPGIATNKVIEPPAPIHMDKMQGAKFDLALLVTEHPNTIELLWNYRKSLFKPGTIESIAQIYLDLLDELSESEE